jgi:hypothetical protein
MDGARREQRWLRKPQKCVKWRCAPSQNRRNAGAKFRDSGTIQFTGEFAQSKRPERLSAIAETNPRAETIVFRIAS